MSKLYKTGKLEVCWKENRVMLITLRNRPEKNKFLMKVKGYSQLEQRTRGSDQGTATTFRGGPGVDRSPQGDAALPAAAKTLDIEVRWIIHSITETKLFFSARLCW